MEQKKIAILGAGIAGLTASHVFKENGINVTVYEKNDTYGGLCNSFEINNFIFDTFAHLSFSKNVYVNNLFEKKTSYFTHSPEALNYKKGKWIRNPVQNNLYNLDVEEKVKIIKDFINRTSFTVSDNYDQWLRSCYGDYFTDNYPAKYTRKYWTVDPKELEAKWVEGRMYIPSIDELLTSAMTPKTPNVHYSKEMHYPKKNGYKGFLKPLIEGLNIKYNKCVKKINPQQKNILFSDGEMDNYDIIISTLPLPELAEIIFNIPDDIKKAADQLDYTSGVLVSLGFNKPEIPPALWFYLYDEDIYPARIYSPSLKSKFNTPAGCSSLQAEIYFSKRKPLPDSSEIIAEKTIRQLIEMNLFKKQDLIAKDVRTIQYANVMFTAGIYENRKKIHDYLRHIEFYYAGRFGEWDYLWTDQSVLSGKKVAEEVIKMYF